jgi:hypothetical protein
MAFPNHLHQAAAKGIAAIPASEARDAYAVSFYVYDQDDDPRQPTVTIGYNTESRVRQIMAGQRGSSLLPAGPPSDEAEARWLYAFWPQDELAVIGDSTRDPAGARLREAWLKDHGWWYSEPENNTNQDWEAIRPLADQITRRFVTTCAQTASQLHADGLIRKTFGRTVPVLIHELEYYGEIADQTEIANPPGIAADFTNWVRNQ